MIPLKNYDLIYRTTRKNAARRGIEFELTRAEFQIIIDRADGKCELSGLSFDLDWKTNSFRRPFAPSLDRINNSKGYFLDNLRLVCVITNFALGDWGIKPLTILCNALNKKQFDEQEREQLALRTYVIDLKNENASLREENDALKLRSGVTEIPRKRKNGSGSIRLRKDGSYESRIVIEGKPRSLYAPTEAQAVLNLKRLQALKNES